MSLKYEPSAVQARFTKMLQKYDKSRTGKLSEEEFGVMLQVQGLSLYTSILGDI